MQYEAIEGFSGIISMYKGEVREIPNEDLAKELVKAGFIKKYKPNDAKELKILLDEANSTIKELEKTIDELNIEIDSLKSSKEDSEDPTDSNEDPKDLKNSNEDLGETPDQTSNNDK